MVSMALGTAEEAKRREVEESEEEGDSANRARSAVPFLLPFAFSLLPSPFAY
jgi:hypothetical protein